MARSVMPILIALLAGYALKVSPTSSLTFEHDLGYIGACETASVLTYCGGIIKHEVPAYVARQSQILEFFIEKRVNGIHGDGMCKESVKRALCKQRFPVCFQSENRLTVETDNNCEQVIQKNCDSESDSLLLKGLCSNYSSVLYEESCRTLSDHLFRTDQVMAVCNLPDEIKLTDWMFHLILQIEAQSEHLGAVKHYPHCYPDLVNYQCSYGYCKGDSIKSNNTQEGCTAMQECFPSEVKDIVAQSLPCKLWPSCSSMTTTQNSMKSEEETLQLTTSASATHCAMHFTLFFIILCFLCGRYVTLSVSTISSLQLMYM